MAWVFGQNELKPRPINTMQLMMGYLLAVMQKE